MTLEDRINRASELFKSGYNCSQSVVAAFADMYGFTEEQALRMAASFGGGIGRMRETCGAACGMFLLAGLEKGAVDGADRELCFGARACSRIQETKWFVELWRTAWFKEESAGFIRTGGPDRTVLCQKTLFENGRRSSQNMG